MDWVKNSLRELKGTLGNIKDILRNMQKIIEEVLLALAKINTTAGLDHLTNRPAQN